LNHKRKIRDENQKSLEIYGKDAAAEKRRKETQDLSCDETPR
jgi:hypothetical protein